VLSHCLDNIFLVSEPPGSRSRDHTAMTANVLPLPMSSPEIAALTSRIKAGDEEAFDEFYESYCDRLYRYLIVVCRGNEDLSRELLQTTMLKVARSMRRFATETELWNWLAAIARNSFVDAMRRIQRSPQMLPLLPGEPDPSCAESSTDAHLLSALEETLAELPADERELIEESYFKGASHQSIAAATATTAKAVESKLARLRHKLRTTILKRLRHENA
jgi:RNA polymerase sigma-70 factor (ECF subfamily)